MGVAYCTFRVASNERRYDREKSQWIDGETTWVTVNTFRSLAEHAGVSFSKGDRVVVNGRLRVRKWVNGDRRGTAVEIEAEAVGHDLRFGTSRFTKLIGSEAGFATRSPLHDAVAEHPAGGAYTPGVASAREDEDRSQTEDATAQDAAPGDRFDSERETQEAARSTEGFTPPLAAAA